MELNFEVNSLHTSSIFADTLLWSKYEKIKNLKLHMLTNYIFYEKKNIYIDPVFPWMIRSTL